MRSHLTNALLLSFALSAVAPAQGVKKPADQAPKPAPTQVSFKEAKLVVIDAWLAANKTGAERPQALGEAADLAFELGKWDKAKGYAEAYGKETPKGERATEMKMTVARAWAQLPGGTKEAKALLQKEIDAAGDDFNTAVGAAVELADVLVDEGDTDGAKKLIDDIGTKYAKVRGLGDFLKAKTADWDEIGKDPIAIDVKGLDGKPIKLADYKGKVTLLDFWATWCGPCVQELPNVIATYKRLHPRGFEIVGISLDQEGDEQKLKDFLAAHDMTWPQYFDGKTWQNEVAVAYGVKGIPRTYLLDKDGKIWRVGLRGPALGREVEKLLAKKSAAPAAADKAK